MSLMLPASRLATSMPSPRVCRPIYQTEALVQAAAADAEVRLAMAQRDVTNLMMKLQAAEKKASELEVQVQALGAARSAAEARLAAADHRVAGAEARAAEAHRSSLDWEARAAVAESRLAISANSAGHCEREADVATTALAAEVQKRIAAERRAVVAEGSLACLQARVETLAREVTAVEIRAADRIRAAENQARARNEEADRRVSAAEKRAQSCGLTASNVIAEFRRQTAENPMAALSPIRSQPSLLLKGPLSPRRKLRGDTSASDLLATTPSARSPCGMAAIESSSPLVQRRSSAPNTSGSPLGSRAGALGVSLRPSRLGARSSVLQQSPRLGAAAATITVSGSPQRSPTGAAKIPENTLLPCKEKLQASPFLSSKATLEEGSDSGSAEPGAEPGSAELAASR